MVRGIINWCDKGMEKIYAKSQLKLSDYAKAAGYGAVEGACDGLFIDGIMLFAVALYAMIAPKKD